MSHPLPGLCPQGRMPGGTGYPRGLQCFQCTIVFIRNCTSMKTQDKFPYDSATVGTGNVYHTVGSDSFYVNSLCILAADKIVSVGKEYIIFDYSAGTGIKMSEVILVDAFYRDGNINLIVRDVRSKRLYTISQVIKCRKQDCTWIFVDLNYLHDLMDAKAIRDYCGCDDQRKRAKGHSKLGVNEDLLDFEF